MRLQPVILAAAGAIALAACTHTIKLEPSDKPIKIDLNVNITQEVRIKLDREVSELIDDNPDLF
ncbi:YnbE family lipoprotein [Hyphomonas sp. WL0036]|uniref:YnbE family lipoprotein n=1 Tax=Hyphomonas sediminis TaxID=2866160 RepID=UPI001C8097B7|nr:YnbE family lipoprotein [Hyphomonas sediminis]MBY9065408.1 YnbE family lipoprotein [Hyphomonas sediminis]